ncbi:MAG: alcohol dehydrogenase catalytic domain-containing protein, partial [Bacteroidota bacterium]
MEFSKDYVFDRADGPGELKLIRRPVPVPNSNEVIVSMKAAGLNRSEYMFLTGTYVFQPVFPSKIGTEGAGIIYSLGDEVSGFEIGDEVCVTPNILPQEYGVMGEYVRVPKDALVHKPKQLSFEEAGSIWMALSTAYCGLVVNGGLKRDHGQTVLISAASSSVGVALIQMAKN